MHFGKCRIFSDGKFILRAVSVWFLSAVILTPAAALILLRTPSGCTEAGYASSVLSFLCALTAGISALKGENGIIGKALISAAAICILLITCGYLCSSSLSPDSILSIVSFSFAGCLSAALICSGGQNNRKKAKIRKVS